MKKVLIITNLVHAEPRIPGLLKYLPDFGWKPIILTTPEYKLNSVDINIDHLYNKNVIIVQYLDIFDLFIKAIKKCFGFTFEDNLKSQIDMRFGVDSQKSYISKCLLAILKEVFYYPDQDRFWKKPAITIGSKLIKSQQINAIISSSSPVTSHIIASKLKKQYKIPWIADLRDLWSQNHNYPYSSFRKSIDRNLEIKTLFFADTLVTVSQPLVDKLHKLHQGKTILEVNNGFHEYEIRKKNILTSKFTITYTGQIYFGKQDPTKLFSALRELLSEGNINKNDLEIRFYGNYDAKLAKVIQEYSLNDVAKQYGLLPRKEVQQKQRESQLLLLLNWEDKKEKGIYQTKIFEYLAAKRPILAIGGFGADVIEKLLFETKAGVYAQKEEIKNVLKKTYFEYKHKNEVIYHAKLHKINKYSYRENARILAENLDKIINIKKSYKSKNK